MEAERPNRGAPESPRRWPLNRSILKAAFLANGVLIAAVWLTDGSGDAATASQAAFITGVGELCALYGTYLALVGLLLVARAPFIEQVLGEENVRLHRLIGGYAIVLLICHLIGSVGGFALADQVSFTDELSTLLMTYPWMMAAGFAFVMLLVVAASSVPIVRRRLSYETWSGLHLYAYLAMVLGLGHELAVGMDFVDHPLARYYWVGMFGLVFGSIAIYRVAGPILLFARHRFRIESVVIESSDVVSVYVTGRNLHRLRARAGQYFRFRLLARDEWWRCHPFSISAEPDGQTLRFTIKALGDYSERLQNLRPGARVMLEGPCGSLTTAVRTRPAVALIGGGIGITPLRAIFEELAGKVDVKLIYRASTPRDTVFSEELAELSRLPGAEVTYLVGKRGNPNMPDDPLSPKMIRSIVPDIDSRDVFLCGPHPMMSAVARTLRDLGVPQERIHAERFAA